MIANLFLYFFALIVDMLSGLFSFLGNMVYVPIQETISYFISPIFGILNALSPTLYETAKDNVAVLTVFFGVIFSVNLFLRLIHTARGSKVVKLEKNK